MINVVHIVENLKIGGMERIIAGLAEGIDKNMFSVEIWCLAGRGEIFEELKNRGIAVEVLGMRSPRDVRVVFTLRKKLKNEHIQIVHAHGYTATTLGRLAAIMAHVPVIIVHRHSDHSERTLKRLYIEKFLTAFTRKIICCSHAVADYVIKNEGVSAGKVEVIYNGTKVPPPEENVPAPARENNEFVVGCVASLYQHKGHRFLLEAVALLEKRYPGKVKLVLVGAGILKEELYRYALQLGIGDRVVFHGPVPDIVPAVSSFDAVVLASSEREGLGLSLIEAMALGKPVIGTSLGGIPEVIENGTNGILVKPKDAIALADAIMTLALDRNKAAAMGREGARIAREKFSLAGMIQKVESLYCDLMGVREANEKHTVLFTSSFGSLQGGGQRSLLLLLTFLNKERFLPILIVPEKSELSHEARKLGIESLVLDFPRLRSFKIWRAIGFCVKLRRFVKEHRIRLIHTESPREAFYCGLVGKMMHVPVILHARVVESTPLLDRILYWAADKIIAVSQTAAKRFAFARLNPKVVVVYNGVDLQAYTPVQYPKKSEQFIVGYFGRIHPRKGIEVLIRAMQKVRGETELIVQGDGDAHYLASLKDLSKGGCVYFRAYTPDPKREMEKADVLVLPSIRPEGLSRAILEAMAMGKIIIASDLAENKEAIGEDSRFLTFPIGDSGKLASILETVMQNTIPVADIRPRLRRRAEELFDGRKNASAIEAVYAGLLSQEPARLLEKKEKTHQEQKIIREAHFVCPDCKADLSLQNNSYVCGLCNASWPIQDQIPVFFKHSPVYWGEFSQEKMAQINTDARQKGWKAVVQSEFPAHLRDFILDETRTNWKYLIESDISGTILDVGSGWGTLSFAFARLGAVVYTLEPVRERIEFIAIRKAQEGLDNVVPLSASIRSLPFPDASFDLVILNGVLEWLGVSESDLAPNRAQEACLSEISRVLKPGGSLYIGIENRFAFFYFLGFKDPHCGTKFTTVTPRPIANLISLCAQHRPYRTYLYSLGGYRRLLKKSGFTHVDFYLPVPSYLKIKYLVPLKPCRIFAFWVFSLVAYYIVFTPRLVRRMYGLVKMTVGIPVLGNLLRNFVPDYSIIARKNSFDEN